MALLAVVAVVADKPLQQQPIVEETVIDYDFPPNRVGSRVKVALPYSNVAIHVESGESVRQRQRSPRAMTEMRSQSLRSVVK